MLAPTTESHPTKYWRIDIDDDTSVDIHRQYSVKDVEQDNISHASKARSEIILSSQITDTISAKSSKQSHMLSERELVTQQLLRAGMLVTNIEIPDIDVTGLSEDMLPIVLPSNSKSWEEALDEDRGEY